MRHDGSPQVAADDAAGCERGSQPEVKIAIAGIGDGTDGAKRQDSCQGGSVCHVLLDSEIVNHAGNHDEAASNTNEARGDTGNHAENYCFFVHDFVPFDNVLSDICQRMRLTG